MNLDDLIPLLIFIGIIAFNIFKSAAKKKAKSQIVTTQKKPRKKKGLGLLKLVDNIKAEIEKAGLEAQQSKTGQGDSIWDALSGKVEAGDKGVVRESVVRPESEPIEIPGLEPAPEFYAEPEKQVLMPDEEKAPEVSFDIPRVVKRKPITTVDLSPSKMREAIVLSEILAKPVGMRD